MNELKYEVMIELYLEEREELDNSLRKIYKEFETLDEAKKYYEVLSDFYTNENVTIYLNDDERVLEKTELKTEAEFIKSEMIKNMQNMQEKKVRYLE